MKKNKRGRPKKARKVAEKPFIRQFSPRGHIGRPGYVNLELDSYEALRLADFIGLNQKEAATSMNISQQTYSRVLKSARKALIEGLVLGKTIKIIESPKRKRKGQQTIKNPT